MIKRFILSFLLSGATFFSQAQHVDLSLMTKTWELIAEKSYVQNEKKQWVPSFPAALKALNNKEVTLPGYIIPVKTGMMHNQFMFSVVPSEQCPFCGQGDVPSMVEVHTVKPVRYTDKPVKIKGKLVLNGSGDHRSEFFVLNAALAD